MILLADENVDAPMVAVLRAAGHHVDYVRELDPGIDDRTVLDLANAGNALLLTSDKDFGELVFRRRLVHAGVNLCRLAGLSMKRKGRIIADALAAHGHETPGAFALITAGHIRIRPTLGTSFVYPIAISVATPSRT
jgi:predicted nuclease of predicted toxin-antitoxin system